ncbi:MAG: hypothetical protein HOA17_00680 [Candidatus Melainabacteria bacterium]|jgi:hypothetical protein|nr:hypothetical protein [Candidatus Melainabacteria bacterium]
MATSNTTGLGGTSGTLGGTGAGTSKVIKASTLTKGNNAEITGAEIAKKTAPDPNADTTFTGTQIGQQLLANAFSSPGFGAMGPQIQATPPGGVDLGGLGDIGKMFAGLGGSSKAKEKDGDDKEAKDGDGKEVASKDDDDDDKKSKASCPNGNCSL